MRRLHLLALLALLTGILGGCASEPQEFSVRLTVLDKPIWLMRVDTDGRGEIVKVQSPTRIPFTVSERQMETLKNVIKEAGVFSAKRQFGDPSDKGPSHAIEVHMDGKQTDIRFYGPLSKSAPDNAEVERLLTVWREVANFQPKQKELQWNRAMGDSGE
ncbi:MAG: hypothetical protein ABL949_11170 [Fimbriimonadaceae bacterium]